MVSSHVWSFFAIPVLAVFLVGCSSKSAVRSEREVSKLDAHELTSLLREHCLQVVDFDRVRSDSRLRIKEHCGSNFERARTTNCALEVGSVVEWTLKYPADDEVLVRYSWPLGLYGNEVGEPTRENLSCSISLHAKHEADLTVALRSAIAEVSQIGSPIYTSDSAGGEYWYWNQRYHSYNSFMITAGRSSSPSLAQSDRFVVEIAPVRDPSMFRTQTLTP